MLKRFLSLTVALSLLGILLLSAPFSASAEENFDFTVSDRDRDPSHSASACQVIFSEGGASVSGSGVSVSGAQATITQEGSYIVSGSCPNGRLIVDAGDNDKIQIVLNNLSLSSADGCALLILEADKVFLTLAQGSENSLSDGVSYNMTANGSTVDAVVFSKADLTLNGEGSLSINGQYKHGIVSKDDLVITGGKIAVTAASTGMEGKDCVKLYGGTLSISAGTDGVRSTNDEDSSRGFVAIDGDVQATIESGKDGIQAVTFLSMVSGEVSIVSGGGSSEASSSSEAYDWYFDFFGQSGSGEDSESMKGLKSDGDLSISGGTLTIDSADDALHANGSISVSGGQLILSSDDDGIHADSVLTVSGGEISVLRSYEGLEAGEIDLQGGNHQIFASDDGLNAAGGNDSSGFGGRFGGDPFASDSSKHIRISGGTLTVDAGGDGLDSNGDLIITGGVTFVCGPTNSANGSLDCGSSPVVDGGILVAVGSSGMAQGISTSSAQGSITLNLSTQNAGSTLALCGEDSTALLAFRPSKQFNHLIISAPFLEEGQTYTLCSGTVDGLEVYGLTQQTPLSNVATLTTIEMTSLHSGSSQGGFGGMMGGGFGSMGGGGNRGQNPGMDRNEKQPHGGFGGFPGGEIPEDMPSAPDSGTTWGDRAGQSGMENME